MYQSETEDSLEASFSNDDFDSHSENSREIRRFEKGLSNADVDLSDDQNEEYSNSNSSDDGNTNTEESSSSMSEDVINPQTRAEVWCFTLNSPGRDDLKGLDRSKIVYYVYGIEKGSKTKRNHLQGMIIFKSRIRFKNVKEMIPRARITKMYQNSTTEKCRNYCMKDRKFKEYGNFPKPKITKQEASKIGGIANKKKWDNIYELAKVGNFEAIAKIDSGGYIRTKRNLESIAEDHLPKPEALDGDLINIWITGPTGLGKSRLPRFFVPDNMLYIKSHNKWHCNPAKQKMEVVLYDDLDKHDAEWCGGKLKTWTDRYPHQGEVKFGGSLMKSKFWIVTSNWSIEDHWGHNPEICEPLLRRFRQYKFTNEWKPNITDETQYLDKDGWSNKFDDNRDLITTLQVLLRQHLPGKEVEIIRHQQKSYQKFLADEKKREEDAKNFKDPDFKKREKAMAFAYMDMGPIQEDIVPNKRISDNKISKNQVSLKSVDDTKKKKKVVVEKQKTLKKTSVNAFQKIKDVRSAKKGQSLRNLKMTKEDFEKRHEDERQRIIAKDKHDKEITQNQEQFFDGQHEEVSNSKGIKHSKKPKILNNRSKRRSRPVGQLQESSDIEILPNQNSISRSMSISVSSNSQSIEEVTIKFESSQNSRVQPSKNHQTSMTIQHKAQKTVKLEESDLMMDQNAKASDSRKSSPIKSKYKITIEIVDSDDE